MMIVAVLLVLSFLLFLIAELWRCWISRNYPPGPSGLPLLGYLPFLNAKAPHLTLQRLAQKYGSIYHLRLGSLDTVILASAAAVREFFRHEELTARAPLYVTHGIMGGYGIVCAEGLLWKDQRRQIIEWLRNLGMNKKLGISRQTLEQRMRKGVEECLQWFQNDASNLMEFDPLPALQHTIGNIVNDLVFGVTYARDDCTWHYLQELQEEGLKLIGVSSIVNFLPWLRFLPSNRRTIRFLLEGKRKTHLIYDDIIEKRCQNLSQKLKAKQNSLAHEVNNENNLQRKSSILECFLRERWQREQSPDAHVILAAEQFYCQEQLRHLLADLFGAGVDTTLTTMRWMLLYMAKEQKCQQKLREALLTLPQNLALNIQQLESLNYLRASIAEVQRIRSVVPLGIPHGTRQQININGHIIPKRCMVLPLQWAIHMDAKVWPEPERFKPERFLSTDGVYQQPTHFIPFQTGKRMCVGEEMARMMLMLYTGAIFRRFKVELAPKSQNINMSGECGITLTPMRYQLIMQQIE